MQKVFESGAGADDAAARIKAERAAELAAMGHGGGDRKKMFEGGASDDGAAKIKVGRLLMETTSAYEVMTG